MRHFRAGLFVIGIGITRARAGAAFDDDLMAAFGQLINRRGQQRHAMLLKFNFPWDANNHKPFMVAIDATLSSGDLSATGLRAQDKILRPAGSPRQRIYGPIQRGFFSLAPRSGQRVGEHCH